MQHPCSRRRRCAVIARPPLPLLASAAGRTAVHGAPTPDVNLDSLLNSHVSTAARYAQTVIAAPASITILTADDIARYGWRSLDDALSTAATSSIRSSIPSIRSSSNRSAGRVSASASRQNARDETTNARMPNSPSVLAKAGTSRRSGAWIWGVEGHCESGRFTIGGSATTGGALFDGNIRWRPGSRVFGARTERSLFARNRLDPPLDVPAGGAGRGNHARRHSRTRVGNELVIGIAYQGRNRVSANTRDEVVAALQSPKFRPPPDVPRRVVSIDLDERSDVGGARRDDNVRMLCVAPLRAFALGTIVEATRNASVTTITGVPDYVQRGLAVGVALRGDHPSIVINLAASRREGAEFAAQLLELAGIIR